MVWEVTSSVLFRDGLEGTGYTCIPSSPPLPPPLHRNQWDIVTGQLDCAPPSSQAMSIMHLTTKFDFKNLF